MARTDFANLFNAPRQIFEQVALKYGDGEVGEVDLSKKRGYTAFARPLSELPRYDDGKIRGAIYFSSYEHRGSGDHASSKESATVELYVGVPSIFEPREGLDAFFDRGALLRLSAGAEHEPAGLGTLVTHKAWAKARFPSSEGFSFITCGDPFWPVMREMLDKFAELTEGFKFSIDTGSYAAA